ncbi:unannotated protein [freshwater metagenome]|uniref:Unannotated protein n=1 Tax=freshwater metagenome TaxID=449393 RepID=A0A6J7KQI5_9ZZZZ
MWVVFAHDFASNAGAFHGGSVGKSTKVVHAPKDAAVNGLQAVARVRQSTRNDDRHGVIKKGAFHLLLDLDWLDGPECHRGCVTCAGVVSGVFAIVRCLLLGHLLPVVPVVGRLPQISRNRTSFAFV